MPKACPYVMVFTLWCCWICWICWIACEWRTLLYNIKRSRFLLVGEPALWGMWVATPYLVACLWSSITMSLLISVPIVSLLVVHTSKLMVWGVRCFIVVLFVAYRCCRCRRVQTMFLCCWRCRKWKCSHFFHRGRFLRISPRCLIKFLMWLGSPFC